MADGQQTHVRRGGWRAIWWLPVFIALMSARLLGHDVIFRDLHLVDPELYGPLEIVVWVLFAGVVLHSFFIGDPKVMSDGSVGSYGPARLTGMTLAIPAVIILIVAVIGFSVLPRSFQEFLRPNLISLSIGALVVTALVWLIDTARRQNMQTFLLRIAVILMVGFGVLVLSLRRLLRHGTDLPLPILPNLDMRVLYIWVFIAALMVSLFVNGRRPARKSPGQA